MSDPLTWQRVRVDPALAKAWTSTGQLSLGFCDIVSEKPRQTFEWLTLFDGTRTARALVESAAAMGIEFEAARKRFTQLAQSGAIFQVDTLPAAIADSRIVFDARASGQQSVRSGFEVATRRQTTRLLIHGVGAACYRLVKRLEELGYLVGWQTDSTQRVTVEDVHIGDMPDEWMGRRWSELGRALRDPHIVILVRDVIDFANIDVQFPRSTVLPIQLRTREIEVGPLVGLGVELCGRCVYTTQVLANPDWPLLLTQWLHHQRANPLLGIAALDFVAASVIAHVEHLVATGNSLLFHTSLRCSYPDPRWTERQWSPGVSQDCSCQT